MITDNELTFWIVCGILAVLFAIAVPFINDYLACKDTRRRLDQYSIEEEANKE